MRLAAAVCLLVLSLASVAVAQTNDTVYLPGGAMIRGTVLEFTPGDHVVLQLATGEVRTYRAGEFVDVAIGPTAPIVVPVPVMPPAEPMAHLTVDGDSDGLSLHRVTATATATVWTGRGIAAVRVDAFELICHAPCEIDVPAGSYELGVAPEGGDARRADHDDATFAPGTVSRLTLEYDSREGVRIAGWLVFGLGVAAGLGLILGSIFVDSNDFTTLLIAGSVVSGVSMIAALPMIFLNDHSDVRFLRDFARAAVEGVRF